MKQLGISGFLRSKKLILIFFEDETQWKEMFFRRLEELKRYQDRRKAGRENIWLTGEKFLKIDAHIHLTPKDVIDANIDYDGRFIVNGSIDDYEKIMKTYNIECAFIMPFNDPYMLSMEPAVEAVNKNMKNMISGKINRFYCFADVDIRKDIEDMLFELEQVLMTKRIYWHQTSSK